MKTIEETESVYDRSMPLDFARHPLEVPELSLKEIFYPLGFATELRTNSAEILSQARDQWSMFEKQFDTEPIWVDVHVVEGDSTVCPPAPICRIMYPLVVNIADKDNYSIVDLERGTTRITVSRAAEKHSSYLRYFFLLSSPLCHIATRHVTTVHAGCVALSRRGILLCGDSGAGKSSLSYACARAGWTYVSDDASYVFNGGTDRLVIGASHQVRFRPSAAQLFPEVDGLELTPRAAGKPSIELPTATLPGITCAPTAQVDFLVFLNRNVPGAQELVSYPKDVARRMLQQGLYGSAESLTMQHATLERLLTAEIFELRYTDLNWAVLRLETLVRAGR